MHFLNVLNVSWFSVGPQQKDKVQVDVSKIIFTKM